MKKYVVAKNGRFVLTEFGFEQFKVRMFIQKDNKRVPVDWVENGWVVFVEDK